MYYITYHISANAEVFGYLNVTATFQDASDQQGGVVSKGNSSQFYNLAMAYGLLFLQKGLNVMLAYNVSRGALKKRKHWSGINL